MNTLWYCGCCGNTLEYPDDIWCLKCRDHVAPPRYPYPNPWGMTYESVHGVPCPFAVSVNLPVLYYDWKTLPVFNLAAQLRKEFEGLYFLRDDVAVYYIRPLLGHIWSHMAPCQD